jgi:hypothetical protein
MDPNRYANQLPPADGALPPPPGIYNQAAMQPYAGWGYQRPPMPYYPRNDYQGYNGYRPNSYGPPSAGYFMDREDLRVKRARLRENAVVENALTQSLTGTLGPATAQVVAQAITDPSSEVWFVRIAYNTHLKCGDFSIKATASAYSH